MLALSMTAVQVTMDLVKLAKQRGQDSLANSLAFIDVSVTPRITGARLVGTSLLEVDPETFADMAPAEIAIMALDGKCRAARAAAKRHAKKR